MTYNLEAFKANATTFGGARANKFNVIVNNKIDPSGDDKFNWSCKGAELPEAPLGQVPLFFKGRPIQLIGDRPAFPNWVVSVYNDEDFVVKNAFERWNSAMNSHQGNVMSGIVTPNPYSYKSDAIITHTSMLNDIPLKKVKIVGMFPVRVGQVTLDWETTNQVEIFEVEFAYDYWVSEGTTDGI